MGVDVEARQLRRQVRARLFGEASEDPVQIGRFRVQQRLGRGGMGVVYAAHDPELDRPVAIKILRTPGRGLRADPARQRRLVREAQAMAKLAHPNVIPVYDVGTYDDGVYVAMELVDGDTLGVWLTAGRRSWREILDVFIAAGEGMAAAHAAGLVHRDFKPDNVIVGRDGRVRVLDFGLARPPHSLDDTQRQDDHEPTASTLTETGAVLGTPAYMAPEQHDGEDVDVLTDQFSFCVSLFESLVGHRPYVGDTRESVRASMRRGLPTWPKGTNLPATLVRAVNRGLHTRRSERWPAMDALLDTLRRIRRGARWPWAVAGTAVIGVAVAAGYGAREQSSPCPPATQRLQGVWDPAQRSAVEAAFIGSDKGYIREAWVSVAAVMDERTAIWVAQVDGNCQARHDERAQSESAYLWRQLCLEDQLREFGQLTELLARGEPDVLEGAPRAAQLMPDPRRCSPDAAQRDRLAPPSDPDTRAEARELRLQIAATRALQRAGRYADGSERAASIVSRAREIRYPPVLAEALLLSADLSSATGDVEQAEPAYTEAIETADAVHHDHAAARAWIGLVSIVGSSKGRHDEGRRLAELAEGAIARLGGDEELAGRLAVQRGAIAYDRGEFDVAIRLHNEGLGLLRASLGTHHPSYTHALHGLARSVGGKGDYALAVRHARNALAIAEQVAGRNHPDVAYPLTTIGTNLSAQGQHLEAVPVFERVIELLTAALGPDHPRLADSSHNLGGAYVALGRYDEALVHLRRAAQIDTKTRGADNPHGVASLYALAMALHYKGEYAEAEATLLRGQTILERAWGPDHPNLAYILVGLGQNATAQDEPAKALGIYLQARDLLQAKIGPKHPRLVASLGGASLALLDLGRPDDALPLLEQALDIGKAHEIDPVELSQVRFALARALRGANRSPQRAVELARSARQGYAEAGPRHAETIARIDAWLAPGTDSDVR